MRLLSQSSTWSSPLIALSAYSKIASAIDLNPEDETSIISAASSAANGLMSFYSGNLTGNTPGLFPQPYYWWEAGAAMGALIDYWYYTGDTTYNSNVEEAMLNQVGENTAFMPGNQTQTEGNDDQGFWGIAAISAAERGFPNPSADDPQWLELAQGVFNTQASRWDPGNCGGGLRWQIFSFNNGYTYKNTISNGCFFHIAARLARYTNNATYAEWAKKTYEWVDSVGLVTSDFKFVDGAMIADNCSTIDKIQWTYNSGIFLAGAAYMYNYTNGTDQYWHDKVVNILNSTELWFFKDTSSGKVMYEAACEQYGRCNVDQRSFKGFLSRWMALTALMAPFTADTILPLLKTSAVAAASNCIGGQNKQTCGFRWYESGKWDGNFGVGEQMSALEVMQNTLVLKKGTPLTADSGGTSKGDPSAGTSDGDTTETNTIILGPTTMGDKVGAGFLTTLVLSMMLGGAYWLLT